MTILDQGLWSLRGAALAGALLLFAAPAALAQSSGYDASQAAQACAADQLDPGSAAYSNCVQATLWNDQDLAAR